MSPALYPSWYGGTCWAARLRPPPLCIYSATCCLFRTQSDRRQWGTIIFNNLATAFEVVFKVMADMADHNIAEADSRKAVYYSKRLSDDLTMLTRVRTTYI